MDSSSPVNELPDTAHQTIASLADLERIAERSVSQHQRWIERTVGAVGRPRTVYSVLTFVAVWVIVNTLLATHGHAFDPPPFAYLDCLISLAALMMTIFILTTENRINLHDARRDRLDQQINLLNERKISKVIDLLEELRRDSPGLPDRDDQLARELSSAVNPEAIVRAINERAPNPDSPDQD